LCVCCVGCISVCSDWTARFCPSSRFCRPCAQQRIHEFPGQIQKAVFSPSVVDAWECGGGGGGYHRANVAMPHRRNSKRQPKSTLQARCDHEEELRRVCCRTDALLLNGCSARIRQGSGHAECRACLEAAKEAAAKEAAAKGAECVPESCETAWEDLKISGRVACGCAFSKGEGSSIDRKALGVEEEDQPWSNGLPKAGRSSLSLGRGRKPNPFWFHAVSLRGSSRRSMCRRDPQHEVGPT